MKYPFTLSFRQCYHVIVHVVRLDQSRQVPQCEACFLLLRVPVLPRMDVLNVRTVCVTQNREYYRSGVFQCDTIGVCSCQINKRTGPSNRSASLVVPRCSDPVVSVARDSHCSAVWVQDDQIPPSHHDCRSHITLHVPGRIAFARFQITRECVVPASTKRIPDGRRVFATDQHVLHRRLTTQISQYPHDPTRLMLVGTQAGSCTTAPP